jgi:hypothetical protein
MEQEQAAARTTRFTSRNKERVTWSGNMRRATFDMTASKAPSGKGSRRLMSATMNRTVEPILASAWPTA